MMGELTLVQMLQVDYAPSCVDGLWKQVIISINVSNPHHLKPCLALKLLLQVVALLQYPLK